MAIHHIPQHLPEICYGCNVSASPERVKHIMSTFMQKFNKVQLNYSVREQELLAAYEACKFFPPIIYRCDITIRCDHMNNTGAESQQLSKA